MADSWADVAAMEPVDEGPVEDLRDDEADGDRERIDPKCWQEFIKTGAAAYSRPLQRPLVLASLCTGMGTEAYVCHKLNIPFKILVGCDIKNASSQLHLQHMGSRPEAIPDHWFPDLFALLRALKSGRCLICMRHDGRQCNPTPSERVDILVSGFPCQPFSAARRGRFTEDERNHSKGGFSDAVAEAID
eukprot:3487702-Pyramimonas_sp.AAC.1